MKSHAIAIRLTALVLSILLIPHNAYAQLGWCCMDESHAGSTATERCENNMITFAKEFECKAHKDKHDQEFGHNSTCSASMGGLPTVPAIAATDLEPASPDNSNTAAENYR